MTYDAKSELEYTVFPVSSQLLYLDNTRVTYICLGKCRSQSKQLELGSIQP
jgi:hypothetical protein